jgi:adenylosuccinate synthase
MRERKATIVIDLGFGDAGKGTIVDYLSGSSPVATVVRFNGGGQAAHNVVTPDGMHHTFAQFGSGTFVPGVKTHLSRHMLVSIDSLMMEAQHLFSLGQSDCLKRLTIDREAKLVTRFQRAANRIRERSRGLHNHGSCGMGIGETMMLAENRPDLLQTVECIEHGSILVHRLKLLQEHYVHVLKNLCAQLQDDVIIRDDIAFLIDPNSPAREAELLLQYRRHLNLVDVRHMRTVLSEGDTVFEGAQGVLLDESYGFHPYTTWSTTTSKNALELFRDTAFEGPVRTIGVLRTLHTRHGVGPFVTEEPTLQEMVRDQHNVNGTWQGGFRIGWFDLLMARYALEATRGVDALALTHLDWLPKVRDMRVCNAYRLSDGREITAIDVLKGAPDLLYQESLTNLLFQATPLYRPIASVEQEYIEFIESELQVPIELLSRGPTSADKGRRVAQIKKVA